MAHFGKDVQQMGAAGSLSQHEGDSDQSGSVWRSGLPSPHARQSGRAWDKFVEGVGVGTGVPGTELIT